MHEFFDERKREKIETNKKTHSMGRKGNYSLCLHSHRTFISILVFIPTSLYSGCTVLHAIWFRRCVVSMDHVRHTCMHWIIWLWLDIPSVVRVCCFCFSYTWCLYFRFPLCFVFSVISQYGVCVCVLNMCGICFARNAIAFPYSSIERSRNRKLFIYRIFGSHIDVFLPFVFIHNIFVVQPFCTYLSSTSTHIHTPQKSQSIFFYFNKILGKWLFIIFQNKNEK